MLTRRAFVFGGATAVVGVFTVNVFAAPGGAKKVGKPPPKTTTTTRPSSDPLRDELGNPILDHAGDPLLEN